MSYLPIYISRGKKGIFRETNASCLVQNISIFIFPYKPFVNFKKKEIHIDSEVNVIFCQCLIVNHVYGTFKYEMMGFIKWQNGRCLSHLFEYSAN